MNLRKLGWIEPTIHQVERALLRAHPLSAIALPEAEMSSDLTALTQ